MDAKRAKAIARSAEKAHTKAKCALRDHPTLGRYMRLTPTGRLRIDRAKVAAEERLDGKFLLSTSDPDITAEDVALGYKNLLEAERSFRDLKGILRLRPVYHRLEVTLAFAPSADDARQPPPRRGRPARRRRRHLTPGA